MTASGTSQGLKAAPDWPALWSRIRRLHPIYVELGREFAVEMPAFRELEDGAETAEQAVVERAQQWLKELDDKIEVHQLRQFLQTSSVVHDEGLVALMQHFIEPLARSASVRDKLDFLLVQYFSQEAPTDLRDEQADIAYVSKALEPVLGKVESKTPLWLNGLDRVLDAARRCRSLDELLHGGILDQGRKAKAQAGDLYYMPIALVGFTRYGYLMRRAFFRLMHADLNHILEGLSELEAQGVETIDCRRAQFSQQEPILRLRMICQSWKVMFQAEYSSGQPLRMLVDLRASVDFALGNAAETATAPADPAATTTAPLAALPKNREEDKSTPVLNPKPKAAAAHNDAPEFEVATAPEWTIQEDQPSSKQNKK